MAKGLLANFLIVPVVAWILAQIIPMEESSTGFLLVSVCAGQLKVTNLVYGSRKTLEYVSST